MDGWFKFEKDFEKTKKNDKRGAIITVHYESKKKVISIKSWWLHFGYSILWLLQKQIIFVNTSIIDVFRKKTVLFYKYIRLIKAAYVLWTIKVERNI